jgi:ABC-type glycerol-3-phosphate transport system substrate-binding protein
MNTTKGKRFGRISRIFFGSLIIALIAGFLPSQSASAAQEIRFMSWAWQEPHIKLLKEMVADWNKKNPNSPVKLEIVDEEGMYTALSTGFLAGTAPDVIDTEAAAALQYAQKGYLYNLTSSFRYLQDQVNPGIWKTASSQGKLFGTPWFIEQYMVAANVDLVKKLGGTLPKPTDKFTWEDLRALAKKVTTPTTPGLGVGLSQAAKLTMVMGPTYGAKYFVGLSAGTKAKLVQGDAELAIVKNFYEMIQVDKSIDARYVSSNPQTEFMAGTLPLIFTKNSLAGTFDTAKNLNYQYLPMVSGPSGSAQAPTAGIFSVSARSKVAKDSIRFVQYLMSADNLAKLSLAVGGGLPGTTSGQEAVKVLKKGDANWQQIMSQGENLTTAPFLFVPQWEAWKGSFQNPQARLLYSGKITLADYKKAIATGWAGLR